MGAVVESLKESLCTYLSYLELLDKEVRARGLQNEQWFLDFQDKLNALSVK